MEEEHLFISDVHLGTLNHKNEQLIENDLLALIDYAINRSAKIYVLGDLFDYWMEFPNSNYLPPIGKKIVKAFERYNNEITPALYITGNHDNWTLGHFKKCGFDVENEYRIIKIFDKKICLMHGDGIMKSNKTLKRPLLHTILRSKAFLYFYRNLFLHKTCINLMRMFSISTRKINRTNTIKLNTNAEFILNSKFADIVFMGHDHIPRSETFKSGLYINLGTFFHHRSMVRGINGNFSLVHWNAHNQQFNTYKALNK